MEQSRARGLWDELQSRDFTSARATFESESGPVQSYSLDRIQRQIPPDTALVSWTGVAWPQSNRGEYWACVVRAIGPPRWVRLTGEGQRDSLSPEELSASGKLLTEISTPHGKRDTAAAGPLAASVAAQRFDPIIPHLQATDRLPTVRHLVVIMPGPCHAPLEVLTDAYTISYCPSATIYAWLRERAAPADSSPSQSKLLAIGAAADSVSPAPEAVASLAARDSDAESWPSLPGTQRELQSIAALFGERARTIAGAEATPAQLTALVQEGNLRRYRYLHFAMHGEANHTVPLQSALVLGNATNTVDVAANPTRAILATAPRLTAQEILATWRLDAQLVTLSACDTALGPSIEGEYLVGFTQAFLLAGSRSVVASMWAVRDDSTALLMHRFYQNLTVLPGEVRSPLTTAAALQEAKQWLRTIDIHDLDEQLRTAPAELRSKIRRRVAASQTPAARPFDHPYFWAPFILIGDDGRSVDAP